MTTPAQSAASARNIKDAYVDYAKLNEGGQFADGVTLNDYGHGTAKLYSCPYTRHLSLWYVSDKTKRTANHVTAAAAILAWNSHDLEDV